MNLILIIWVNPCVAVTLAWPLHVSKVAKQGEEKDQASDTYKWLPCTWKSELSLADSSGAELTSMTSQSILPEVRGSIPHWRCVNTTGSHTIQWLPTTATSLRSWYGERASHGKSNKNNRRGEEMKEDKGSTYRSPIKHDTYVIGPGWTLDINWQDSSKRREWGNQTTLRKESDVAVTLARPLHVSKVGQSKEKGNTKQATLISDFHAHGNKSSLWPIRLARS